jgi:hypothetical protein
VRWFVRAGTDRDSVVSVGLLRESLRGPRKFGCSGPKSPVKLTRQPRRGAESRAPARRARPQTGRSHADAGRAAGHLERHPEGFHRPATSPSFAASKNYFVTGNRTRGRPVAAPLLDVRILIRGALYLSSAAAARPGPPAPATWSFRTACCDDGVVVRHAARRLRSLMPVAKFVAETDTRLRLLRVPIDI